MSELEQILSRIENRLKVLPLDAVQLSELTRVCVLSEYLYEFLMTDAGSDLYASGDLFLSYDDDHLATSLSQIDSSDLDGELRRIRNREIARIIFRDLSRRADMVETTRDLSLLADACIKAVLDFHYRANLERLGQPVGSSGNIQQMCVLALGKLGANELNVSSDIDLVFIYGEAGMVDGESGISNQEFFIRTSQQIIKSLDTTLPSGFVFRVDMRLRPYGDSGAIILNRVAMEKYFVEQGRDWERYAFIKARACAGDIDIGDSFLSWLQPFVYRQHLDYGAIEALRNMKQLIDNEGRQKQLQDDIKLGPGGIREVEFIVQSQQLIWGGTKPLLRQRRLLEALDQLEIGGYLPKEDTARLRNAYRFLRNSEHAIQAEKDRQTQQLPDTELSRQRLAMSMGCHTYDEYYAQLQSIRDQVTSCFNKVMGPNSAEKEIQVEGSRVWVSIWNDPSNDESANMLNEQGFSTDQNTAEMLQEFRLGLKDLQDIAIDRIQRLMPVLLSHCARQVQPDEALRRLLPIINAVVRRSTYLAFLLENVDAMTRLVHLCAMSAWVADQVCHYPILMYELTDRRANQTEFDPSSLQAELDELMSSLEEGNLEEQMDAIRQFKNAAVLRVAIFELLGVGNTMKASDRLTDIASIVLNKAVELALEYVIDRYGEPADRDGGLQGRCLAVVGYGKLGGIELAYGSDLDIVMLHDADIQGKTVGKKPIPNNVFFSRLGQRIVHILSSLTRFGLLYEIDLRLRADGNKGPLIGTFNAYDRYLEQDAWTWEHQALVRARYVAGNPEYRSRFEEIRQKILALKRDEVSLVADVTQMRSKMRKHLDNNVKSEDSADDVLLSGFDLKHGAGAIVDIEFLVQYLVLANCHQFPDLARWTDKMRLIDILAEKQLLTPKEAAVLQEAYVAYRGAVHYTWLGGQMGSYDQLNVYRGQVVQIWQDHLGSE